MKETEAKLSEVLRKQKDPEHQLELHRLALERQREREELTVDTPTDHI